MAKRWKKDEETYLKRYAHKRLLKELAERFKTDEETVEAKLGELGLAARDMGGAAALAHDAYVKKFEQAIRKMHQSKWKDAAGLLREIVDATDLTELGQSARRYLDICEERLAGERKQAAGDPYLEAVYLRNLGELDQVLDLCARGGRQGKDERFAYLAASVYALKDEAGKAAELLGRAIELNPRNRVAAIHDEDFAELRRDPSFAELFTSD